MVENLFVRIVQVAKRQLISTLLIRITPNRFFDIVLHVRCQVNDVL